MSFRSEVRAFMQKMNDAFVKHEVLIKQQEQVIESLTKQNKDLLNRLMARDFPEFQTYTPLIPEVRYPKEEGMDFSDEGLNGTIVAVEGEEVE